MLIWPAVHFDFLRLCLLEFKKIGYTEKNLQAEAILVYEMYKNLRLFFYQ